MLAKSTGPGTPASICWSAMMIRWSILQQSRRDTAPELAPGVYGLSNHLLDSPWPKLLTARQGFTKALASLPDPNRCSRFWPTTKSSMTELPDTGNSVGMGKALSAIFVRSEPYGTRASTVVMLAARWRDHLRGTQLRTRTASRFSPRGFRPACSTGTRSNSSTMSALRMRMQPCDAGAPHLCEFRRPVDVDVTAHRIDAAQPVSPGLAAG
jgi:hypothetical protein